MLRIGGHLFGDAAETLLSYALRNQKLDRLEKTEPQMIVSANVGCIAHLQSGTSTPITHWIQLLEHMIYG